MSKHVNRVQRVGALCKCGCGQEVPQLPGAGRPRVWIEEHKPGRTQARMCECGCGNQVIRIKPRGPLPKFMPGHSPSAIKRPYSVRVP